MSAASRHAFAEGLAQQYGELTRRGKPAGVLKNLYIKLMCWLYYRFERLMPLLGRDDLPKLLYFGEAITAHELTMLAMLRDMGADVLMVLTGGDEAYLRVDPESKRSQLYTGAGMGPFPEDFTLRSFRKEMAATTLPAPQPANRNTPAGAANRRPPVPQPTDPAPSAGAPLRSGASPSGRRQPQATGETGTGGVTPPLLGNRLSPPCPTRQKLRRLPGFPTGGVFQTKAIRGKRKAGGRRATPGPGVQVFISNAGIRRGTVAFLQKPWYNDSPKQ